MFWTLLIAIFFVFKPVAFADTPTPTPTSTAVLSWGNSDSSARRGEQFNVNVRLTNATAGSTYHVRAYGAASGASCAVEILYNGSWSNGCYVGNDAMPSFVADSSGSYMITLSLRANLSAASGTYSLYSYIPELSLTSAAQSITINDPIPTGTPTPTPTVTPIATLTPKPTVVPTDTPMPILTPVLESTPTDSPVIAEPTPTSAPLTSTSDTSDTTDASSSPNYLPLIFIGFGALLLILTLVIPKIVTKIKSKKNPPNNEPPAQTPPPVILPPTVLSPPETPVSPPQNREQQFLN